MGRRLGVEIEFTGVSREEVVVALENLFECKAVAVEQEKNGNKYTAHKIKDKSGNSWILASDRSIAPEVYAYHNGEFEGHSRFDVIRLPECFDDFKLELVSPVLTSKTLPTLFSIVDVLKGLGAITNNTCGIHVHIDAPADIRDIVSLYKKFCAEQYKIFEYFSVEKERLDRYCMPYDESKVVPELYDRNDFIDWLWETQRDVGREEFTGVENVRSLRYYALNFYSMLEHDTIEFRLFNSTLDRVEVAEILD